MRWRIHGGQTHSQSPEPVHPCLRLDHACRRTLRRQFTDRLDRRRPGHLPRTETTYNGPFDGHYDKPVVPWSSHPLGEVPEGYPESSAAAMRRPGNDVTVLAYGTMVYVAEAAVAETGIDAESSPAHTVPLDTNASRRRSVRPVVRHRARGDPHQWIRRRTVGDGARAVLLRTRGADRAGHRLGHAVPARPGVGLLPWAGSGRCRVEARDGGLR